MLSTLARDQSSRPATPSRSRNTLGGAARTPRPWPIRSAAARPSRVSRSPAPGLGAGARGGGAGHVHDRGEAVAVRDGAAPTAPLGTRWRWKERLDDHPQIVGHERVYQGGHGAGSCHSSPKVTKRRLILQPHFAESLALSPVTAASARLVSTPPQRPAQDPVGIRCSPPRQRGQEPADLRYAQRHQQLGHFCALSRPPRPPAPPGPA
jgi:hypothetical protein